jgi:hypothetical protein
MVNIGTIEWNAYYKWLLTGMSGDSHVLTLPFEEIHKANAKHDTVATSSNLPLLHPMRQKRKIATAAKKKKAVAGAAAAAATSVPVYSDDEREAEEEEHGRYDDDEDEAAMRAAVNESKTLFSLGRSYLPPGESAESISCQKKIVYLLFRLRLPEFRECVHSVFDCMYEEYEKNGEISSIPRAGSFDRQCAHNLFYSLACIRDSSPLPFSPLDSGLILHTYRFMCDKGDNIFAAAISDRMQKLRRLLFDQALNAQVRRHFSDHVTFPKACEQGTYEAPDTRAIFTFDSSGKKRKHSAIS